MTTQFTFKFHPATIARQIFRLTDGRDDLADVRAEAAALIRVQDAYGALEETAAFTHSHTILGSYLKTAEAWGEEILEACPELLEALKQEAWEEYTSAIENM